MRSNSNIGNVVRATMRVGVFAAVALALTSLALATAAIAGVTGDPAEFNLCPINFTPPNGDPFFCSHSETTGGQLTIGNSTVTISNNPDTVDLGAYSTSGLGLFGVEVIVTPTNGQVFGGPAQVVPGGLLGLTGTLAPLSQPLDPINQVTSSIELAGPITPATVVDPTATMAFFCGGGPVGSCLDGPDPFSVVTVPIKVHLHNDAVLGPSCYIGSDADPIVLNLVETPTSSPVLASGGPGGNALISTGVEVADNTFAVPGANGCGLLGALDAALDLKVGLPSPSGKNSALIDENGEVEAAQFLLPPTPTPTPTLTATATATPTAVPTIGATATATATATVTETVTASTATPTATATPTVTGTATPTATPTPGKLTVNPLALSFAQQEVGTTSAAKNVTLTNPNRTSLQINTITNTGDFSISSDGCSGTSLAPSANCVVSVDFGPTQTGTRTGVLTITDTASNSPQAANLSGTGILVKPTFSPTHLSFGDRPVEVASAPQTVTLTNPNSIALSVTSAVPSGDYTVTNDTCSGTQVAASGTCTFDVIFTPSQTGTRSGKIIITDNATPSTQTYMVAGAGILVTPTVSPKSLSYGKVQVNTVSPPQTVTLSNSNQVEVTFSSIATSGPYAITANSCDSSVPANSSCQVSVTFNPTTDSKVNGTTETGKLVFTDNGQSPTQTVTLSGIAFGNPATATPSNTPTPTATATGATPTATATATATVAATATATATATRTATATATATATRTATATATTTATATQTATSTATVTATATPTVTATSTTTATATATAGGSSTPSATPTSTPGPEAGSVLIAGGDEGGQLGGFINLATDTVSSNNAQVFNASTDTFLLVGNMNSPRESAVAVPLPNGLTLIVGGQSCSAKTVGGQSGFQCDALQTSELYNENTRAFTLAGSGSGGLMTIARSGPSATLISGSGTALDGQVLIVGGSTGSSFLSITAPTPGPGVPTGQVALSTAEVYNPATDAFTATTNSIPGCPAGTSPPACTTGLASICAGATSNVSTASESGTTVTITMSSANPTGLTVGDGVTISNLQCPTCAGTNTYDGSFTVLTIPDSTHFTYTSPFSGLTAGSGGTAASDTFECGMVDQGAALIPNDNGKVLLTGGDILTFLGQASNTAFLFDPATQTFSRTGSMTNARELFPLIALDPAVVTGALSGQVVAYGGIQATSHVCLNNPNKPVLVTTLNSAEVYNPATGTWSAAANTMGVKRAALATLIEAGSLAGEVILPGGVDVEAGTAPSTCVTTTGIKQAAEAETDLYDPATGTGGTFAATGSLNQAREGQGQGEIGAGTEVTEILAAGGACTTTTPSLQSVPIGTSQAATTCSSSNAQNDYSELYSQSTGTWTVGPAPASGFTPTNAPAAAVLP